MADQGAYTCEAMNSEGSVLATPDAIVNVIERGTYSITSEVVIKKLLLHFNNMKMFISIWFSFKELFKHC